MNLLIFLVIVLKLYEIQGLTEMNNTDDYCKAAVVSTGCNDGGSLLEDNVCINADYQKRIPPNKISCIMENLLIFVRFKILTIQTIIDFTIRFSSFYEKVSKDI